MGFLLFLLLFGGLYLALSSLSVILFFLFLMPVVYIYTKYSVLLILLC